MADPRSLSIIGFNQQPLDNQFWPSEKSVGTLAILLAGLNYNMDMPILFFARRLLLWRGVDVLNLNPNTRSNAFKNAPEPDQLTWLQADMQAGIQAGLAQSNYRQLILVGKSIGSLAIATVLEYAQAFLPTTSVWLTPLLRYEVVFQAAMNTPGPQVHLCGGADSTYKADRLQQILNTKPNASAFIAEGANHILEVPGDDQATFTGFSGAMLFLGKFLDSILPPTGTGAL
jgi:hypothetical protein